MVRNALSVGFSNASPFFLGGTELCCEGRLVRSNTHVPARSCGITPARRETARVLCRCQCVSASALAQGAGVRLFVRHLKSVSWPLNYTRNTQNTIGTVCGLYTALLFNDIAMTQRFLNSSQHSFHVEIDEKYHVCLPSDFLKSRHGNFW